MTNQPLQRLPGESVYDYEDRLMAYAMGDGVCMERTVNGAAWAMPCTKPKGHEGECGFSYREYLEGIERKAKEGVTK